MTHEEYRSGIFDVAYLASCAVNGRIPDQERVSRMDLTVLYQTAARHLLTSITAIALESAGIKDAAFTQALGKAIRKAAVFDAEKEIVLDALEKEGIWYLPLKGAVLKDYYPKMGMRQMADIDILYDASRMADVRIIMEGRGFTATKSYGRGIHDHYNKPPVLSFEMHRVLFSENRNERLAAYYRDVRNRMIPDDDSSYGCHLSKEDFYIHIIAHEYKHYSGGGTGLRSLLDTYVYILKEGDALDWPYITGELEKLEIADFEAQNRSLAMHLFSGESLTAADEEMLEYMLSSGTYGTAVNRVNNRLVRYGKGPFKRTRYVFSRIFLPMRVVRASFPKFAKYPVLLPFLPFYRIWQAATTRKSRARAELKALAAGKTDKKTGTIQNND